MSTLLAALLPILHAWAPAFAQRRSALRAISQSLGLLLSLGRRTISRSLWTRGLQHQDWSSDYKLHARAHWSPDALFQPILQEALHFCPDPFLTVAMDDTCLRKTGRKILSAFFQRDPLSPKFRFNLLWGLRFLHFALLLPLYRLDDRAAPRALPIRFLEVPAIKRPGKKASAEQLQSYRAAVKKHNLSQHTVSLLRQLRQSIDPLAATRVLLAVGDGSFCNRTILRASFDRTEILVRARKNIRLCHRASQPSRAFYGSEKFTPEQVRQDEAITWKQASIFHGGQFRQLRFKEIGEVLWQTGAGRRTLRLLIVAPTPYSSGKGKRKYYRDPAYLLTTDLHTPPESLLQAYFDRWQIEVSHRELKNTLGVGQAQLRSQRSVSRQPAMMVAAYSALLLAGLKTFGFTRAATKLPLPKWRRKADRPSLLDLITCLRNELTQADPALLRSLGIKLSAEKLVQAADA